MKLSVLICTRNRAASLTATLERFFAQQFTELAGDDYELIVIDNASTDETQQVIAECAARHPGRVVYLREARPGLSRARNAGIQAARGEVIAFTDDDVLVATDWLAAIRREFVADPSLMLLGGRVLLARDTLQRVSWQPASERQYFQFPDNGNFAMGANMAFRRALFDEIGLFDPRLGAGRFFAGAEEAELMYRAVRAGHRLLYAPTVLVYHDHDRTTVAQACRLEYGYGKGGSAYLIKHALAGDGYALRMAYWLARGLPRRWLRQPNEPDASLRRRRAQIRGLALGFLCAPLALLGSDGARPQARKQR